MKQSEPFKYLNKKLNETEEKGIEILEFLSYTDGIINAIPNPDDIDFDEMYWSRAVPIRRIALSMIIGKDERKVE